MTGPKMIGAGASAGRKIRIFRPGETGYNGRVDYLPPAAKKATHDHWRFQQRVRRIQDDYVRDEDKIHSDTARDFGLIVGGLGAGSAGLGLGLRHVYNQQNKKLERKVKKSWDPEHPAMWQAERTAGGHKIHTMDDKPRTPSNHWRVRFGRHLLSEKGELTAAALTSASLLPVLIAAPAADRNKKLRRKQGVSKLNEQQLAVARRIKDTSTSMERRTRALGVINAHQNRTSGRLPEMRRRLSEQEWKQRNTDKVSRALRRTWNKDKPRSPGLLVPKKSTKTTLPDRSKLDPENAKRLGRPFGRGVEKALVVKEWEGQRSEYRSRWGNRHPEQVGTQGRARGLNRAGRASRAERLFRGDGSFWAHEATDQDRAHRARALALTEAKARPARVRRIFKALKDPQKAYEGHVRGAQAKGQTPLSFEEFVARAGGAEVKQKQREAEAAAEKEARQHKIIPETHPWRGKPLTRSHIVTNHVARGQVRNAATSALLAGGTLGALAYSQRQRKQATAKRDTRKDVNTALGATAGAATMDALNTVGGQSAKAILKERRNRRGVTPHQQQVWGEHKRKMMGLKAGEKIPSDDSIPQHVKAKTFMHYPKGLPDWRAQRVLGFKNTKGWTAGSLAGAAVTGGLVARRRTKTSTAKSLEGELPRAARRAAKKGRQILSDEEIAQRRAEAAARRGEAKAHGPKTSHPPKAEKQPESAVRPRSSFLGRGQVRDLAIGVPLGAGALYYGTRKPRADMVAKGSKRGRAETSGVLAGSGLIAHGAEGEALHRASTEMHRVNAHNNADVPGRHTKRKLERLGINEENAAARSADRAKHIARALGHVDNARYLRNVKSLSLLGALGAGYKATASKADVRRNAQRTTAGAVGGAALLDAADTLTGASLKRIGSVQRDRARAKMTPEQKTQMNRDINEHGRQFGFTDERGRGRAPKPSDAHALKNRFYRTYPKHLPGARVARLNALRDKKTGVVLTTGALLGGGLAAHRQVNKGLSFSQVGLLTGSGTAGTLIGAAGTRRQDESHEAVGALAGGWAGQGLYQAAGYGPRKLVRGVHDSRVPLHERDVPKSRMQTPEQRKAYDRFRRERRKLQREFPAKVDQKRHTPRSWHGARTERILAHTHGGRLGTAIGTGATALGVGAGLRTAQRYDRNHQVGKAAEYGFRTKERSWPKTAEMVGGIGLLGYGVPRIKALGPASDKGVKFAEKHGAGQEARAIQELARALGQRSNEITGRGESQLRRIRAVDDALRLVPKSMRGEIATAAGVLVAAHAHPTTKDRFTPIGRS